MAREPHTTKASTADPRKVKQSLDRIGPSLPKLTPEQQDILVFGSVEDAERWASQFRRNESG